MTRRLWYARGALVVIGLVLSASCDSPAPTAEEVGDPVAYAREAIDETLAAPSHRVAMTREVAAGSKWGPMSMSATIDHIGLKRVSSVGGSRGRQEEFRVVDGVVYGKATGDRLWTEDRIPKLDEWDPSTKLLREIRKHGVVTADGGEFAFTLEESMVVFEDHIAGTVRIVDGRVDRIDATAGGEEVTMSFTYRDVPPIEAPPRSEISDKVMSESCSSSEVRAGDEEYTETCTDSHGNTTVKTVPQHCESTGTPGDDNYETVCTSGEGADSEESGPMITMTPEP